VCSPYRDRRDCGAPKPGKKKQKRYNYGCAILIFHRFPGTYLSSWNNRIRASFRRRVKKRTNWRDLALISEPYAEIRYPKFIT
jgi:hypothetical protein